MEKPVVVCMQNVAASGGYYVSAGADHIVAHHTTVTGSIGVVMPLYDVSTLMQDLGIKNRTLKAGEHKDIGSPFVERTEEEWNEEKRILTKLLAKMHARFVSVVAEGRGMKQERVRELANGRIFTSTEAKEVGLIDEIGYQDDAVDAVKKLTGLRSVHLVAYSRRLSLQQVLMTMATKTSAEVRVGPEFQKIRGGKPMYLWTPGADRSDQRSLRP
jgi:protease-4